MYPWRSKVDREGGEIITVRRSPEGWTSGVIDAISERTAIVAVPNCHWTDGAFIDLNRISEACKSINAALVVDATQSLGALPLDVRIRQEADGCEPTVHADPDSAIGLKYREIARRTAARLAAGPRDRKAAFPKIVVEGSA